MFTKKPNCTVTVHRDMKPELFCDLKLQKKLGFAEGDRLAASWQPGFFQMKLFLDARGREWKRRSGVADGPLVGQSRLRIKDPSIRPLPRFQPIKDLQAWLGPVGKTLVLELSSPLQIAPKRSISAYRRAKSKRSGEWWA